ncbi:potassium-transporting ATPase subunit KdpC [Bordetella petrii]|nr:potassium-transporting ATPase subunit KdpC [Bordetella petrii]
MQQEVNHASCHVSAARGLGRPVVVSAVLFMLVTGIAYPMLTTGVARVLFPSQSQGSLVQRGDTVIGSAVIGQNFVRREYFHPRPSATVGTDPADSSQTIDQPYNAASSGASNQGATSKKLIGQVQARVQAYRQENGLAADAPVPVDAVTASGSGLDPDISIANARLQAKRVANARGIDVQRVMALIDQQLTPRQFGVLGEPRLNVLRLNLALDASFSQTSR